MGACCGKHHHHPPPTTRAECKIYYNYPATTRRAVPATMRRAEPEPKPKPKPKPKRNINIYIPMDIVGEIVLNLPVKSLLRFRKVSESWRSMIMDREFVKRYRLRASLPGRETIVLGIDYDGSFNFPSMCDVSSMPTHNPADVARPLIRAPPNSGMPGEPTLVASCNELWCFKVGAKLVLWNPSIQRFRKLPAPLLSIFGCAFGLGYDSVGDEYKLLKVHIDSAATEVYSLSRNSWRETAPFPAKKMIDFSAARFVGGALYWMVHHKALRWYDYNYGSSVIISFDLSSEKYGEMAVPEYHLKRIKPRLSVWKGRLSVYSDYVYYNTSLVMWVREDDGWTKEVDIVDGYVASPCTHRFDEEEEFYFYDKYRKLIRAQAGSTSGEICFIEEGKDPHREVVRINGRTVYRSKFRQLRKNRHRPIFNTFTYVQSPVLATKY